MRPEMSLKTAMIAVASVLLATGGQLLLRSGMKSVGYIGGERLKQPLMLVWRVATTPNVIFGLALFVASAGIWLVVLSRTSLSLAYPFAGLTYVLTTLFARYVLHEKVTGLRWAGVMMIVVGIIIIGKTAPPELN